MPHSIGRLSASASSHHSLSSAAFITNIAESDFRYTQVEKAGRPKSVVNAPDLAAAALTGDPTSTRKDIVARAGAEEVERLREMRGEELIALAGRESLVTLVLAQRQARDALHTLEPKQMGDLQKALSGSLLALVEADKIARQATAGVVQTPTATSNGEVIEHDTLSLSLSLSLSFTFSP